MLLKLEFEEDVEKEFQTLEMNLEKERSEKEQALVEKEQALETLKSTIKSLHSMNMSLEQIASITGKDIDFVKQVL
ncbi:MAG: hypothetical protein IPO21_04460 [Bacteroidales bacterium]|nr:hypothetical protein [Bacteroidales bacterium]